MTSEKRLRAQIDEKTAALVKRVLLKAKKPMLANEIAAATGLDVHTTSAALARLRNRQQAKNKGAGKTGMLWVTDTPLPPPTVDRKPHRPSIQPNGSPEFWAAHMAEMNAPARRELKG